MAVPSLETGYSYFRLWKCVAVVLLCLSAVVTVATSNDDASSSASSGGVPFDADEIDDVIRETFQCKDNPGLAVSVVRNGELIFSNGYGVTSLATRNPVTPHSLFGLASLSKAFAATLLVKLLYEKTELTVDSKVKDYPDINFRMSDKFRSEETTFADLMGHRTALPSNNRIRFNGNVTRDNIMDYISQLDTSPYDFRVKYIYSNVMYGLVTSLAERLGGAGWEELISQHLYQPLGMDNSSFLTTVDFSKPEVSVGYNVDSETGEKTPVPNSFSRKWAVMAGSGAIMSSASDMAKWMNFHLHQGRNSGGEQVMQQEHLEEVHKSRMIMSQSSTSSLTTSVPQFPVKNSVDLYAHGFMKGFYRGYPRMSHTGATKGYRAMLSLLPTQNIGVFTALTGRDDSIVYRGSLHMYLLDRAMGLKSWLNASTICSYPEPWKAKKVSSPLHPPLDASLRMNKTAEAYEGTYHNSVFGHIQVHYNTSLEALVLVYGWAGWRLYPRPHESSPDTEAVYAEDMGNAQFNLSPLEFSHSPDTDHAVAVRAVAFEKSSPPVFHFLPPGSSSSSSGLPKPVAEVDSDSANSVTSLMTSSSLCVCVWLSTVFVW